LGGRSCFFSKDLGVSFFPMGGDYLGFLVGGQSVDYWWRKKNVSEAQPGEAGGLILFF